MTWPAKDILKLPNTIVINNAQRIPFSGIRSNAFAMYHNSCNRPTFLLKFSQYLALVDEEVDPVSGDGTVGEENRIELDVRAAQVKNPNFDIEKVLE